MTPDDQALVDRFLDMMAAEAGASRHTLAAYRNDLERSAEALGAALGQASANDLSRHHAQKHPHPPVGTFPRIRGGRLAVCDRGRQKP